jgi:hypothetical protein
MFATIFQIVALILLAFALRRAIKRDRISELALRGYIRTEVKNAAKVIISEINTHSSVASDTLTALERMLKQAIVDEAETRKEVTFAYDSLSSSLINIAEKQYPKLLARLFALEAPIAKLTDAQIANTVKEGEARRTLYNRIQERDMALANLQRYVDDLQKQCKAAKEAEQIMKETARTYLADLNSEINFMLSWMGEKGMPTIALEKALKAEFKGEIPSHIYQRVKSEKLLSETINDAANA